MTQQTINIGTAANDRKGDSLRAAFQKVNTNFTELYTQLGLVNDPTLNLGAFEFTGSTISTTDSTPIVIDQATTISSDLTVGGDILPNTNLGGNLGSPTQQWKSLYVSTSTIYINNIPLSIDQSGNLTVDGNPVQDGGGGNVDLQDITINGSEISSITSIIELKGNSFVQVTGGADLNNLFINDEGAIITVGDPAKHWTFGTNGQLTLPVNEAGNSVLLSTAGNVELYSNNENAQVKIRAKGGDGDNEWKFRNDGTLEFPAGYLLPNTLGSPGQVLTLGGQGGTYWETPSYTPNDANNWLGSPTVNTISAALDELAARLTAFENLEIDGGNANTPAAGELLIDGNGA